MQSCADQSAIALEKAIQSGTVSTRLTWSACNLTRFLLPPRHNRSAAAGGHPHDTHRIRANPDPVGAGYVASVARPGGNATGFTQFWFRMSGKWLELLKEMAPGIKRAAVIRDARDPSGMGQWGAIDAIAPALGIEVSPVRSRDPENMERGVTAFVRSPTGGLVVTASSPTAVYRERIVAIAARHRLPADYPFRYQVATIGLPRWRPNWLTER